MAACLDVGGVLRSLGAQVSCHALTLDGHLLADILLPQHSVALLVEGPAGYVRNTGACRGALPHRCAALRHLLQEHPLSRRVLAGDSISRDRLFRARGWEPVSISKPLAAAGHPESAAGLPAQQAFLRSQLPAGVLSA